MGAAILLAACCPSAFAQSTPTEFADMALEDLLKIEVNEYGDENTSEEQRWAFSYTYRRSSSGGYRSGTTDLTFDDVLFSPGDVRTSQNFPVLPTYICQYVHAFSGTYALNDKVFASISIPYISQSTEHISSVPGFSDFTLKSDGIGDIGLNVSYQARTSRRSALQFTAGLRLPTGSIDKKGDTPRNGTGTLERLPYTMQIGSGTVDIAGAANYSHYIDNLQFAANINGTLRTGANDNGYRLGHNYGAAVSAQYSKLHWFQPGLRISVRKNLSIAGQDDSLLVPQPIPFPASITNPDNFGGTKVYGTAFVKICPKDDCSYSLSAEIGEPIYQNLEGIQPKDRHQLSLSLGAKF